MNQQPSLSKLADDAWLLYKLAADIQKLLLAMFFDQFLDIEEQERHIRDSSQQLPF